MKLQGTVYRARHPRWSFALNSGDGAARYGGRFNPVGMAALYSSWRVETAWREGQQGFAFKSQPLTICAYEVDCEDVADLTDSAVCADFGIDPAILGGNWEDIAVRGRVPPSWDMARQLGARGVAAIVVPSYAPGALAADRNLVFYRWSDALPHRVVVIDDDARLPKDDGSWR